jgi:hypothetical protein
MGGRAGGGCDAEASIGREDQAMIWIEIFSLWDSSISAPILRFSAADLNP